MSANRAQRLNAEFWGRHPSAAPPAALEPAETQVPLTIFSRNAELRDTLRSGLSEVGLRAGTAASVEPLLDQAGGLALVDADELQRDAGLLERLLKTRLRAFAFGMPEDFPEDLLCDWLYKGLDGFLTLSLPRKVWCAHVRARILEMKPAHAPAPKPAASLFLRFDQDSKLVWIRRGSTWRHAGPFTRTEFQLLSLLARHSGQLLSRAFILENLWRNRADLINSETINKHIQAVRRKLGGMGKKLRSVFGEGYILDPAA
jgi:DNA-binding response OmpR family regulator